MELWVSAVKKCCGAEDEKFSQKLTDKQSFAFTDFESKGAKVVFAGKDFLAYSWKSEGEDYLLASGKGEKSEAHELQDKLENIFDRLLGEDGEATLYAARYAVIDDMIGLEVCGETNLGGESVIFYGIYLSDKEEGYYIIGLGSSTPEFVFDELTGAARRFYRKPYPATILKGKVGEPLLVSLRSLATEILPDKQIEWNILNATFNVTNGQFDANPSIIVLKDNKAVSYKPIDVYDEKDFSEFVASFLSNLPDLYDISGFTVTNFKDGRYGITYYPSDEKYFDENDEDNKHGEDCGCNHNHEEQHQHSIIPLKQKEDYSDLDSVLDELTAYIAENYPKDWQNGMGLVTYYDGILDIVTFYSNCGPFVQTANPKAPVEVMSGKLANLNIALENHYAGWNAFAFSFAKNISGFPDLTSVRDEAFNFDIYIDAESDDIFEYDDYLLSIADFFIEEFKDDSLCVSYVTFKVTLAEDGFFVVEPATAGTDKGVVTVQSFNSYLPKISSVTEDIFEEYGDCNTISVTIFPERKFGFYLEKTEPVLDINRRNIATILKDYKLDKYQTKLIPLIRDEFMAIVYEVEVETSLATGVSKLGGNPDLPKDFKYPLNSVNKPMEFVAQINFEEVYPFDKSRLLPDSGVLSFFYDKDTKSCKVYFFEEEPLSLWDSSNNEEFQNTMEYLPARLRFIPSVSLPILDKNISEDFFENEEDEEKYADISDFDGKVKIFGYADSLSEQDVEKEHERPLKLLLQVPSIPECDMLWSPSGGTLHFWIEEDDLKLLDFSKCFCILADID